MIKMSDGTEWVPPTLERVQAYISSQGERRLAQSARLVVAKHAESGSRVGVKYEKAIRKVDCRAGVKIQTRAEILGPEKEEVEEERRFLEDCL
jgi:predicted metallo-beta-lactamase superfamily hydrolase